MKTMKRSAPTGGGRQHQDVAPVEMSEVLEDSQGVPYRFAVNTIDFRVKASLLMKDLWIYIPFLICFVFFFIHGRNIGDSFFIVNSMRDLLLGNEFPNIPVEKHFGDIAITDDWHMWMQGVVIRSLWDWKQPNASGEVRYAIGQNVLLGSLRVRTHRVTPSSCVVNPYLYPDNQTLLSRECYGKYKQTNEDRNPYGGANGSHYTWSDPSIVPGTRTTGDIAFYENGGFVEMFDFEHSFNDVLAHAKTLEDNAYIDNLATRFVIVEFFIYTPQFSSFTSCKLFNELTVGGSWVPNTQFRLFKVWSRKDAGGQLVFDILLLLFVLFYVWKFVTEWLREYRKTRRLLKFIFQLWNFLEFVNLTAFLIVFGLKIAWAIKSDDLSVKLPFRHVYPGDLEQLVYLYTLQVYFNSLNTVISFLKLLKFVRLNDRLNILTRTMEACQQNIIGVLVLFIFVLFGYSITGNTLFGNTLWDWRNLNTSFSTLMRMLLGDFDYPAMREENRFLAGIFFWSFVVLGLFLLLNFIIAIIAESFSKVSVQQKKIPLDVQIVKSLRDLQRSLKSAKKRFALFCARKSEDNLLRQLVDKLEEHYRSQLEHATGFVDEDDFLLFKSQVHRIVQSDHKGEELLHDLGDTVDHVWMEVLYEWRLHLENDEETEKKEQEERIKAGVRNAMTDSIAAVKDMDSKVAGLETQLTNIYNLVRATSPSLPPIGPQGNPLN